MEVEDIPRISFASRWPAQDQGNFPVGNGLFGQVIVNNQGMAPGITKIFPYGSSGKRSKILHGCRITRCGRDNGGIFHGSVLLQGVDYGGHSGSFLADGHIYAINGISGQEIGFLVYDRIYGNGGLSGLPVSDDQFPLSPAYGYHGVNGFNTCLKGFGYRFAKDYTGRFSFQRHGSKRTGYLSPSVQRITQGIYNPAQ